MAIIATQETESVTRCLRKHEGSYQNHTSIDRMSLDLRTLSGGNAVLIIKTMGGDILLKNASSCAPTTHAKYRLFASKMMSGMILRKRLPKLKIHTAVR